MKRIIVLASLLAISMNTGFAAILGSASSDIDTLRAQGFSESTLKVVDLVRYNNRGMNGTYERRFITKEGNKLGRAYTHLKTYVDPTQDDNLFGEHQINFVNTYSVSKHLNVLCRQLFFIF